MINLVVKHLTGELNPDEKKLFLLSVIENKTLRTELIEFEYLFAHYSLLSQKEDQLKAQISLLNFMEKNDQKMTEINNV